MQQASGLIMISPVSYTHLDVYKRQEFTIKTLAKKKDGSPRLLPANSTGAYSPIDIKEGMSFEIWGVVTGSFRRFK